MSFNDEIEQYARLLHKDSCIRRGEIPRWLGKGTNRAYWRRMARRGDDASSPTIANQDRLADQFPNPETEERG